MNKRKQLTQYLNDLPLLALLGEKEKTKRAKETAGVRGDCALEACLYFDLRQIEKAIAGKV